MAKRTNEDLLQDILSHVGGVENILTATNCMTRLRIQPRDESKIDLEQLKDVEGVMGVVNAETLQIVVGPGNCYSIKLS